MTLDPDDYAPPRPLHVQAGPIATVFAGGFVGTAARAGVQSAFPHAAGTIPWATFAVNVIGCFILGCLLEALVRLGADDGWRRRARLLLGTGFCGAFTTYSSLAVDTRSLLASRCYGAAAVYVLGTLIFGLLAVAIGFALARRVRPS